ncbi:MAG: hypothetical protein LBP81_03330 [Treponema sp.]|jgi:uncharacterized integral membrane protein|nr:hypothetical protein [Treponema sp.]
MPWRLIGFIVLFGILLVFITLNLGNTCNISLFPGFEPIKDVPVFLTVFCSFALGLLCAIPLSISFRLKKKSAKLPPPAGKKSVKKKKGGVSGEEASEASSFQNESPYGID